MELEKTPEPHPFKVENRRGAAFVRPLGNPITPLTLPSSPSGLLWPFRPAR